MPNGDSAAQLRREAAKARTLADHSFNEDERQRLHDIAASLDREALAIDAARVAKRAERGGRNVQRPAFPSLLASPKDS